MKKTILPITLLLTLAFVVTACGSTNSASSASQSGQTAAGTGQGQGQGNNRPISPQLQLAVGTFKLEGTPQAVNATEAAQLIPLWQLYSQLETSTSSAQQEVTATFNQIKDTMTPDQINAINAMNLTNQEAFTFMQQQGILQAGGFGFNGTPQADRTPRAGGGGGLRGGGGGFPGGGGPGGGAGGTQLNPSQIATAQARRAQGGGFSNRLPSGLLNALIKLLQSKVPGGLTSTPAVTSTDTPAAISTDTPAITLAATPTP
ncbi:MAG: hypothetical protein M1282_05655 [Chloroflexi bacterium]|nr:hypothetical protein [Chloroflexota bacterium]